MTQQLKSILITGASTGIGYEAAKACIARGYQVYGSVRKQADADRLSNELGGHYAPLFFDVTDADAVVAEIDRITPELKDRGLHALINNSGIAKGGPIQYQDMEEIAYHFQVNVLGLIRVTKACLSLLGAQKDHPAPPGKIINISSVAGKFAQPFVGSYVSSKHAVEGFSHSLRRELLPYGVQVVIVGPGAVKTPIWDKGIKMDKYYDTPYGGFLKRFGEAARQGGEDGLSSAYLGKQLADIVDDKRPKLRYTFVKSKLKNWIIPMLLPHRWVDRFVKNQLHLD